MADAMRRFKADIFQALAHPTRVAIVEALRDGELAAAEIMQRVQVEQANLSQHLAVLRAKQVVRSRKAGNQVFYAIKHPVLIDVLDLLKRYYQSHLRDTVAMLDELTGRRARKS
jgi:DNA-binding transcriptional ArsR family regulator